MLASISLSVFLGMFILQGVLKNKTKKTSGVEMSQRTTIFRPPTPGGDELLLACLWPWNSLRDKTSSAYLAQVFSKFRWPGNLSVFYGTQFGKCYQKQIPRRTCESYSWAWIKTDCEFSLAAEDNVASHIPLSGWHQGIGGVLPFMSDGKLCLRAPQPCFPFPSTQKEWPDQVSRMQT